MNPSLLNEIFIVPSYPSVREPNVTILRCDVQQPRIRIHDGYASYALDAQTRAVEPILWQVEPCALFAQQSLLPAILHI